MVVVPQPTPVLTGLPQERKLVLFHDGKLVEGGVTTTGDKVLIKRGSIDQAYNKDQIQFIGSTKDEVYQHRLASLKSDDAAARLKLARWCMYNGMREQALTEAREVVRLQPTNAAAAEMARTLDESLRLFPTEGGTPKPAATPPAPGLPAVPPPAGFGLPPSTSSAPVTGGFAANDPDPAITPEAVVVFGPKVHPVLVNLCADCHAKAAYKGSFKLAPTTGHTYDPDGIRQNLRVAAAQLKKDDPSASPLLTKALAMHGGMRQPLIASRETPAFRILAAWATLAMGSTTPVVTGTPGVGLPLTVSGGPGPAPTSEPGRGGPVPSGSLPLPPPPPPGPPATTTSGLPAAPALPPPPKIPPASDSPGFAQTAKPLAPDTPGPVNPGEPVDEFDPSTFNRANPPASGRPAPKQ